MVGATNESGLGSVDFTLQSKYEIYLDEVESIDG
jgi:hypothetical protein